MHLLDAKYSNARKRMILPNPISPENSLYYTGSVVIEAIGEDREIDVDSLYSKVKKEHSLSRELFILTLDWLYLIEAIENNGKFLKLCSSKN